MILAVNCFMVIPCWGFASFSSPTANWKTIVWQNEKLQRFLYTCTLQLLLQSGYYASYWQQAIISTVAKCNIEGHKSCQVPYSKVLRCNSSLLLLKKISVYNSIYLGKQPENKLCRLTQDSDRRWPTESLLSLSRCHRVPFSKTAKWICRVVTKAQVEQIPARCSNVYENVESWCEKWFACQAEYFAG